MPVTRARSAHLNRPQMELRELVLRVHRGRVAATPNGHAELFPYFEGYCSKFSAQQWCIPSGAVPPVIFLSALQHLNSVNTKAERVSTNSAF